MAGMAGMVEGGPVTEAAPSDRRPLPRTRRRCPGSAPRPVDSNPTAGGAGVPRSYVSQSSKL
jgi:hypothetical protein